MNDKLSRLPKSALNGMGTGLILMAFFTITWSILAFIGSRNIVYSAILITFPIFSLIFVLNAFKFFLLAKTLPAEINEKDQSREKSRSKWFYIVFGAEGIGIFIGINIVINLGHPELQIPVIALIVGLHFFPMARIFDRQIDYYLATYSTFIALLAFYLSLSKTFDQSQIFTFTGTGMAIATVSYGIYMIHSARIVKSIII